MGFQIKRIYDDVDKTDGKRILVDRIWPRGVSKERAALDIWLKDVTPSTELRKWFGHVPERFEEFKTAYTHELDTDPEKQKAVDELLDLGKNNKVTLLYAAKSPTVNHAVILLDYLENAQKKR